MQAIGAKLVSVLLGFGGATLVVILIKKSMDYIIERYFGGYLDKFLSVKDENDRELVYALIKWAEKKLPEPGMGEEKYKLVAHKLCALFPILAPNEEKIKDLIESFVDKMNEELQKKELPPH